MKNRLPTIHHGKPKRPASKTLCAVRAADAIVTETLPRATAVVAEQAMAGDVRAFSALYDIAALRAKGIADEIAVLASQNRHEEGRRLVISEFIKGNLSSSMKNRLLDCVCDPSHAFDTTALSRFSRACVMAEKLVPSSDPIQFQLKSAAKAIDAGTPKTALARLIEETIGWNNIAQLLRDGVSIDELSECLCLTSKTFSIIAMTRIAEAIKHSVGIEAIAGHIADESAETWALKKDNDAQGPARVIVQNIVSVIKNENVSLADIPDDVKFIHDGD